MKNFRNDRTFQFDLDRLRADLDVVDKLDRRVTPLGNLDVQGILLNQIPDDPDSRKGGNVHGAYWTIGPNGKEVVRNHYIDEQAYTEFFAEFERTYYREVIERLREKYPIGRVRLLWKHPRTCLSYHRDPEPRLHIPIVTHPNSFMVIDKECHHMPADGTVWITDTTKYHTAFNGSEQTRVHLVATLPGYRYEA